MDPHPGVDVPGRPPRVQPVPGEALPKAGVVAAAAPLPGLLQGALLVGLGPQQGGGVGGVQAGRGARQAPARSALLQRVQLQLGELHADLVVVQPALGLAATALQLAHAAGQGHGVGHPRRQQRQGEGALTETCGQPEYIR